MAIPLIGALPAMPNPEQGVVQQPIQNALAGGVQAFLQAKRQKQQDDLQKQEAQAKIKQQQIQNAQASLPMLMQMAKAQPGNPQVQAKLKETLGILGMPMPMMPQAGPQQPQAGPQQQGGLAGGVDASANDAGGGMMTLPNVTGGPNATAQSTQVGTLPANPAAPAGGMMNYGAPQGQTGGIAGGQPPGNPLQPQQQHQGLAGLLQRIQAARQQGQPQQQAQPQQPQGQVDINALMPLPPPNEKQTEYLMGLPKGQRAAAAKTMQVAVDPDFLNTDPIFVPGSAGYNNAYKILQQINMQAAQGAFTPDQYANAMQQNSKMFQSAQIDTSMTDPSVMTGLSRKAQADIDKNIAMGAHYKAADLAALQNAKSLEELRAAQAKLAAAHAKALPMEDAMKWKSQQVRDSAAASRAASYASRVTELNKQASTGNKAAIAQIAGLTRMADGDFKATQSALSRAEAFRDHLLNDEGVNPQDPQMAEINGNIDQLQHQLTDAQQTREDMLKKYGGATGLTAQLHFSGLPNGQSVAPKVDITKADQTATGPGNKKIYHVNGAWLDDQGNPVK